MASRGGYDSGYGTGGKIRRRPPSRAAAASPYARPAPAPSPALAARGGEGSGWLTRLISRGASCLLSSVFRKPPPKLAAPPRTELFDAPALRPESLDAQPSQPETLDAPRSPSPSPSPPPLEDDIQEGEDNGEEIANKMSTDNSDKDGDDVLRNSDLHGAMDIEELLKQRTFTRSEFEYLADLLRSRTIGSNTLKAEVSQMRFPQKENGSGDLPVDFSVMSYSVADQVASPAELAKAYMGLRSSEESPLRLRLHNPSSLPIKSIEANTKQIAKSPTLPPLPSLRLYVSTPTDHLGSSYTTPNRSAIHKMSSSPYFKSAVSSQNFPGTVSSSYQTANSVHTFGRQVVKRKSTALNNESATVGPIRKMHQRYNRVSPLLETRPGYCGYLGNRANKLDEDYELSRQTQKRRCLDKVDDGIQAAVDNRAGGRSFGQAPAQSTEMAVKILKQLDTLVPPQKEGTSEIRQTYGNAMDAKDSISQRKEILLQGSLLESSSGFQEYAVLNDIKGAAKFTQAAIDDRTVDASSDRSAVLKSKSSSGLISSPKDYLELENCSGSTEIALRQANEKNEKSQASIPEQNAKSSGATNKEKPPTFSLKSYAPSNLVLSSEIDRSKFLASSNGFSFPAPVALGAHSQAPPTPTMASPPILPAAVLQSSALSSAPVTSAESAPRVSKRVSEEGSISNQCDKKSNAENPPISSKSSGHVASFTANPVFSVVNSKPTTLINGLAPTLNSTSSANAGSSAASVLSMNSNGSNSSVLSTNAGSSVASFPHVSFQHGFQTSTTSVQQSDGTQFKAEPVMTVPFSTQSFSTGSSFSFANTGTSQSVAALSSGSSRAGTGSTPFSFSPKFGKASLLAAQDKCNAGSSVTPSNFSPQFGTATSVASLDKSKAALSESTLLSANHYSQSGNSNSLPTQSPASNSNLSPEKSYSGSLPRFANSSFGSASSSSSFNSSSVFSIAVGSCSTSVTTTAPLSLPATSSTSGSGTAFPASPISTSNWTTAAPPSFGMPNTGSAISAFSSTSSPVFSFTSATPTIPNTSPSTPLFGRASPTGGLNTVTDQMNEGHIIGGNQSPFSTAPPFGLHSKSPSTPAFSTPATQFATTTSTSPGIFQFGQQSQSPSGGFSLGTSDRNDKSGRRIIKVKRKK